MCCAYFPPEGSTCIEDDLFSVLQSQIASIDVNADIIICGDLNARCNSNSDIENTYDGSDCFPFNNDEYFSTHDRDFIDYLKSNDCFTRSSMDIGPMNERGRELLDVCKATKLIIVNGRRGSDKDVGHHTFFDTQGKSLVDYVLASSNAFKRILDFRVFNKFPESDHLPLNFCIPINSRPNVIANEKYGNLESRWHDIYRYVWKHSDLSNLGMLLKNDEISKHYHLKFMDGFINLENVNKIARMYNEYVIQACNRVFETKRVQAKHTSKRPRWYDTNCRLLRNRAIAAGGNIKNESDRAICLDACKEYRAFKQYKRRLYYHECLDTIETAYSNNRSELWSILSKLSPDLSIDKAPSQSTFFSYYNERSNAIHNENFDYSYEARACMYLENNPLIRAPCNDIKSDSLNKNFTEEEIISCIKLLKNKKSAGIDQIPAEFIKYNADHITKDLVVLFNYFLEHREFPESWAEGLRNPIFKSGSKIDPNNYRGITVLPVFEKLFETAVHRRLEFIDEAFMLNDEHNSGFQKGCRTVDNLSILQGIIERQLILNQNVIVTFVDFSKAFDMINRNILFYKINKLGLQGRLIDTLHNLYKKTCFRVKIGGKYSDKINETIGVNQGGSASPILFKKYLHDIADYIKSFTGVCIGDGFIQHVLWADDLILISTSGIDAQIQLDGLSNFCSPNQTVVNLMKTNFMVFGRKLQIHLHFNNCPIEQVDSYKSLGIIVKSIRTYTGDMFSLHPQHVYQQARKGIFGIQRRVKSIGELPPKHMIQLYQSMIQPILTYGSELWGHSKKACETVDKLYFLFVRSILKVKKSTSIIITLGELGVFPPSVYCHISLILFAIRLLSMNNNSLLQKVCNETTSFRNLGFNNWWSKVWSMANSYNIDLNDYSFSETTKRHIKLKIKNHFTQDWQSKLNDTLKNPIIRNYRLYKQNWCMEKYLIYIKNEKYRTALSRFRCSAHSLAIERGRHTKPKTPVEERVCFACNVVEDEMHFISNCKIYNSPRAVLFNMVQSTVPNFAFLDEKNKFIYLFSCEDPRILTHLGKYIFDSFIEREAFIKNLKS